MKLPMLVSLALAVSAAGCAAPVDDDDVDSESSDLSTAGFQTITFEADGRVTGPKGGLLAGQIRVRYSRDRGVCPSAGQPERWAGSFSLQGGDGRATPIAMTFGAGRFGEAIVKLPRGNRGTVNLSLWFRRNDAGGNANCWDSNGGKNFVFPVSTGGAVFFGVTGVQGGGSFLPGQSVALYYDLDRGVCPVGRRSGAFKAFFNVDGGPAQAVRVAAGENGSSPRILYGELNVPAGKKLALWFSVPLTDGTTCWDSNGGGNFTFPIR